MDKSIAYETNGLNNIANSIETNGNIVMAKCTRDYVNEINRKFSLLLSNNDQY